jgi:hypothetical protein
MKHLSPVCRVLLLAFSLALPLTMAHVDPSFARAPILANVIPVDLPDGQVGEMRLFHGDGVIVADPVRLIVLDATGHLVGYSHESFPVSIICSEARKCVGYDHPNGVILEFVPTTNVLGPAISDELFAGLWFGPRNTTMNMRTRAPTWSEFAAANLQMAEGSRTELVFIAVAGACMALLALMLRAFAVGRGLGFCVQLVLWIVALGLEFVLLIFSFWPVHIGAMGEFVWLLSLCSGALCIVGVWLTFRYFRHMRRQPAQV